jgi:ABC-2 type transport system ATP-binding protein
VPRGCVFGLLGPNGAGKTTLAKLLLGIAFPTAGSAAVLGRPPGDVAARARIGYLPENHRYPPHLTGEQVLHHFGRLSGLRDPERTRRVDELLRRSRLEEQRKSRVRTYSKGMMQRLGMAQALLNDPDLLILDEPTDGVDPIGRREIRDLLLERRARDTTILLNSHLLSEVERICDRVLILKDGKSVREGGVDELTRPSRAYEVEARGLTPDLVHTLRARFPGLRDISAGGASAGGAAGGAEAAGPGGVMPEARLEIADDLESLNRLIDALRADGARIVAVRPRRESLEEVFVKVIGEELR